MAAGVTMYAKPEEPKRKFCSTQFNIEGDAKQKILAMAKRIPGDALAEDGRESEPHITIKYGIHDDAPEVAAMLAEGFGPVRVRLGKASIFPAKEATAQRGGDQYDVVKIEVEGDDIHRLNKIISEGMECTDTHPVYKPHATLAYVKAGEGEKYVGMDDVDGMELTFTSFVFSPPDDATKTTIALDEKQSFGKTREQPSRFSKEQIGYMSDGDLVRMAAHRGVPIDARDDRNAILRKLTAS
jgi:2'-5' RNA ligase